jgi:hypothetical protein
MTEPWITGWKRIAAHIGMDEQTAKTMHREYGMPVRELPSGSKVAIASELLDWLLRYNSKLEKHTKK